MKNDEYINEVEIDFTPFFKTLETKGISQSSLSKDYELSTATLYRLRHNQNLLLSTVGHIMNVIGTDDINDVVRLMVHKY